MIKRKISRRNLQILNLKAEKAIKVAVRKAIRAHELAGVPAVVWRDGKVVKLTGNGTRKRHSR